ncbi:hypothetical protein UFOVP707_84 [uncultured Caudovirales phage]|uniref:Uncharacterized protein n=1 Tax=uncultured Caudovirales phage TaxID=2100421 RepID=A0A6J5NJ28_9CAUD|nr:hypothetical protein UFOVP707_84 [uncultured Caudovirales phage]
MKKKSYRPRSTLLTPQDILRRNAKLKQELVERVITDRWTNLDQFLQAGEYAHGAWLDMADMANVAEHLARVGIGSGSQADTILRDAQEALAYCRQERLARGTYALRSDEREIVRERLTLLIELHQLQLRSCTHAEFETAYNAAQRRLEQARAGNASPAAIVVLGRIADPTFDGPL